VKAIAQEIEVRLPNDQKHADDEIAERAVRILAWDIEVPHKDLHVKVSHGVVTLSGHVGYHFQRTAAEHDVRRLDGVQGVINLLTVSHASNPSTRPERVRESIEDALLRSADVEASHITVDVEDGKVCLKGEVRSWFERGVVRSAAWAAPGVIEVNDQLTVQPQS
jgi:osmotically-inducible protein OsmY